MLLHTSDRTFTFWRFAIQIPLSALEMEIKYSINHGQQLAFHVPARDGNMRLAAYSVRLTALTALPRAAAYTLNSI